MRKGAFGLILTAIFLSSATTLTQASTTDIGSVLIDVKPTFYEFRRIRPDTVSIDREKSWFGDAKQGMNIYTVLTFNLADAGISGEIESAYLCSRVTKYMGGRVNESCLAKVYRIISPWSPETASFRNFPPIHPEPISKKKNPVSGLKRLDLTRHVNSWVGDPSTNLGIAITASDPKSPHGIAFEMHTGQTRLLVQYKPGNNPERPTAQDPYATLDPVPDGEALLDQGLPCTKARACHPRVYFVSGGDLMVFNTENGALGMIGRFPFVDMLNEESHIIGAGVDGSIYVRKSVPRKIGLFRSIPPSSAFQAMGDGNPVQRIFPVLGDEFYFLSPPAIRSDDNTPRLMRRTISNPEDVEVPPNKFRGLVDIGENGYEIIRRGAGFLYKDAGGGSKESRAVAWFSPDVKRATFFKGGDGRYYYRYGTEIVRCGKKAGGSRVIAKAEAKRGVRKKWHLIHVDSAGYLYIIDSDIVGTSVRNSTLKRIPPVD